MWLRTWMIMWKEFLQISRDPRMLAVVVAMPILMLLLYGFAINLDVRHVTMGVYDQDRTAESRELIDAFTHSGYFDIATGAESYAEVRERLDGGHAKVMLVIPVGYSRELAKGRIVPVQVMVDGSDSTVASTAIGYLRQILQQHSTKLALERVQVAGQSGALHPVENRARYWYNPELKSTNYIIPGLSAVILMMLAALLTSVTVVRERERGTIESLIVSPVKPIELMLGKLIPYVIIAFFDVILVMVVGLLVFHIPLRGSPWLVLLLSAIFVAAALGIGLFISTLASSQQVAMLGAMMITQLPTVLLSGFIFPVSSMPKIIQMLTLMIPARHFITILRAVFLKGSGLGTVWPSALLLLAIAVAMLGASAARFKKKL